MNYLDEIRGGAGALLAAVSTEIDFNAVSENIEGIIRIVAALGGVVLLFYSIWHKRLLIKREQQKRKNDGGDNQHT